MVASVASNLGWHAPHGIEAYPEIQASCIVVGLQSHTEVAVADDRASRKIAIRKTPDIMVPSAGNEWLERQMRVVRVAESE